MQIYTGWIAIILSQFKPVAGSGKLPEETAGYGQEFPAGGGSIPVRSCWYGHGYLRSWFFSL